MSRQASRLNGEGLGQSGVGFVEWAGGPLHQQGNHARRSDRSGRRRESRRGTGCAQQACDESGQERHQRTRQKRDAIELAWIPPAEKGVGKQNTKAGRHDDEARRQSCTRLARKE
jgi:hypothetical protein